MSFNCQSDISGVAVLGWRRSEDALEQWGGELTYWSFLHGLKFYFRVR